MILALLCCCAAASAQRSTDAWIKLEPEGEAFSVSLPQPPSVNEERKSFAGLRVSGRRYRVQEGGTLYTIWSFKPEAVPSGAQTDKAAYLDLCAELAWDMLVRPEIEAVKNRGEEFMPGEVYGMDYQRELPSPTLPGRNYLLAIGNRRGATQIYLGDGRIYLVAALAEPGETAKPETFMRSFSVGGKSPVNDEAQATTVARVVTEGGGVGPGRGGDGSGGNSSGAGDKVNSGSGPPESTSPVDYNKTFTVREVTKKANIRSKPEPLYTESARKFGITGTVRVRAILSASGEVRGITLLTRLPHGLTQKTIEAARRIKFEPAIKDGRKVSQYVTIEYNYNIY